MLVAITGAGGQLGSALKLTVPPGVELRLLGSGDLDVADPRAVGDTPALAGIDVLINAAAYTAVDAAEDDADTAMRVNAGAPGQLAGRCVAEGAHLVQLSTDYVFGPQVPHRPLTPADPTAPDTVYGCSKLAGERAVLESGARASTLRTAWVHSGNLLPDHRDFVSTMLRLERSRETVSVVDDQHGCPTYAVDLARVVWQVAAGDPVGVRHVAGTGRCTWFELARAVFAEVGADPDRVKPVTSAEYPARAPRPSWSVLASDYRLPEWRSALGRSVAAML